jgi:hypothetical protein
LKQNTIGIYARHAPSLCADAVLALIVGAVFKFILQHFDNQTIFRPSGARPR